MQLFRMLSLVYVLLVHNFTQIDFKISSQIFIIKDMQLTYHIRMYWNLVFAFKQIIIILLYFSVIQTDPDYQCGHRMI